jgi:hypothetical protein
MEQENSIKKKETEGISLLLVGERFVRILNSKLERKTQKT